MFWRKNKMEYQISTLGFKKGWQTPVIRDLQTLNLEDMTSDGIAKNIMDTKRIKKLSKEKALNEYWR